MNLKESFRYQKFLDNMMYYASSYIEMCTNCYNTVKLHKKSERDPSVNDVTEQIDGNRLFENDDVINFMQWLIDQKNSLSMAITDAKSIVGFDIDAAVESNKFRQMVHSSLKKMLSYKECDTVEQGKDYKFNLEGNQMPYVYQIEVHNEEAYDRDGAKRFMRSVIKDADNISSMIDSVMVSTRVKYDPVFDVNESFEDVMTDYITNILKK